MASITAPAYATPTTTTAYSSLATQSVGPNTASVLSTPPFAAPSTAATTVLTADRHMYYSREPNPLIEMLKRMAQGIPPSNEQLQMFINKTEMVLKAEEGVVPNPEMVRDVQHLMDDVKAFLVYKNEDEKIQRFLYYLEQAAAEASRSVGAKASMTTMKAEAYNLASTLGHLVTTLITSPEFRFLLLDFFRLVKDTTRAQAKGAGLEQPLKNAQYKSVGQVFTETTKQFSGFAKNVVTKQVLSTTQQQQQPGGASSATAGKFFANVDPVAKQRLSRRFRQLLGRIAKDREFSRATLALLDMFDKMQYRSTMFIASGRGVSETATLTETSYEMNLRKMREEAYRIVSEFTGRKSLDNFMEHFWVLVHKMKQDPYVANYFRELRSFVVETLEHPAVMDNESHIWRSKELMRRGRHVLACCNEREELEALIDEADGLVKTVLKDPINLRFATDSQRLLRHTFLDTYNKPSPVTVLQSLQSIRLLMIPILVEHLRNVPIPRIEGTTGTIDYTVDNLLFSGGDILPERLGFSFSTDQEMFLKVLGTASSAENKIKFRLNDINAFIRDVQYTFNKHTFPKLSDSGFLDADIIGLNIWMKWKSPREESIRFYLRRVVVTIDAINIRFRDTRHGFLMKIFTKFFTNTVRMRIERMIQRSVAAAMESFTVTMNRFIAQGYYQMQQKVPIFGQPLTQVLAPAPTTQPLTYAQAVERAKMTGLTTSTTTNVVTPAM